MFFSLALGFDLLFQYLVSHFHSFFFGFVLSSGDTKAITVWVQGPYFRRLLKQIFQSVVLMLMSLCLFSGDAFNWSFCALNDLKQP